MCRLIEQAIQLDGVVAVWRWSEQFCFYNFKACLQKVIRSRGLKSRFCVAKKNSNLIEDYVKPAVTVRYQIGRLHDDSKRFMRVWVRVRICNAHVGRPFLKIILTFWLVSFPSHHHRRTVRKWSWSGIFAPNSRALRCCH